VIEKTELLHALPAAALDILPVIQQIPAQCEDQRERVLGNRVDRVVPDVHDRNARRLAVLHVDDVVAGCGHRDELELREPLEHFTAQWNLVGDGDRCRAEPRLDG
jgi:hypothetical protein